MMKSIVIICLGISIVAALSISIYYYRLGSNFTSLTYAARTIDGIQCNTMEQAAFHVHAHLDIFINGELATVPSQIGINSDAGCLYWLHTHDDRGVIHIEAPIKREFTLGNFFDIWGQVFNNTHLLDDEDTNNTISIYVNGIKVPTDMDYRSINLNAHDEIAIVYGEMPLDKIPSSYDFPEGM
ncbi:MAG TPA: hypothetical protein VE130_09430 [Nitrososphaeraceae archaeon]|nr:hypothetical protein [Nitrososphaeraceae archaeon]